jgi:hypothetical protein
MHTNPKRSLTLWLPTLTADASSPLAADIASISTCQDHDRGASSMGSRQGSMNQPHSPRSHTLPGAGSGATLFLPTQRPGRPAKLVGPIRVMLVSGSHAWVSSGKTESSTITLWSASTFLVRPVMSCCSQDAFGIGKASWFYGTHGRDLSRLILKELDCW